MTDIRPPRRIQSSTEPGWEPPVGAVNVDNPTVWGNPFKPGDPVTDTAYAHAFIDGVPIRRAGVVEDAAHAVQLYDFRIMLKVPFTHVQVSSELAGRDLVCSCPLEDENGDPFPCHADTLLILANPDLLHPDMIAAGEDLQIVHSQS